MNPLPAVDPIPKAIATQRCRVCDTALKPFLPLGPMPIGNGFLPKSAFDREYFFDLTASFCPKCSMVQLFEQPYPDRMFHNHYPFFTSSSRVMQEHFQQLAHQIQKNFCPPEGFAVEIGCNDGTFLKHFAQRKIRHVGIDPAQNVLEKAQEAGVETLNAFFNLETAQLICSRWGQADAVIAANVMCHMPHIREIFEALRFLLKPLGVFVFEDPYWGDVIQKTSYDQIYDEHVFLFSIKPIQHLAKEFGLMVFHVEHLETHGGSMRFYVAHQGAYPVSHELEKLKRTEGALKLHDPATYENFNYACETSRESLVSTLESLRKKKKRVAGYAATSKSTTVLNYCQIGPDLIEYICDSTPQKQGLHTPGSHIPVVSIEAFHQNPPDVSVLFAWNHQNEIRTKEPLFKGQWLTYVPQVEFLS